MSKIVTYRMPHRVKVVPNPHFTGGETNYAPYTLASMGPYPAGVYHINSEDSFGGSYEVTETTNTSIKVVYRGRMPNYPAKTRTDLIDINEYEFAYKEYDARPDLYLGRTNERLHHPFVFDFCGQSSPGIERLTTDAEVTFTVGYIPNYYNKRLPGKIYRAGEPFPNGIMSVYGFAVVWFDDLPGCPTNDIEDPTGLGLVPKEFLTGIKGRHLVVIDGTQGFNSDVPVMVYPPLPNDRNVEVSVEYFGVNPPDIIDGPQNKSGVRLQFVYDSLFSASTGPCEGIVLPYRRSLASTTQPVTITLPTDCDPGDMIYFPGNLERPFDFTGFEVDRDYEWYSSCLGYRVVPANVESIK